MGYGVPVISMVPLLLLFYLTKIFPYNSVPPHAYDCKPLSTAIMQLNDTAKLSVLSAHEPREICASILHGIKREKRPHIPIRSHNNDNALGRDPKVLIGLAGSSLLTGQVNIISKNPMKANVQRVFRKMQQENRTWTNGFAEVRGHLYNPYPPTFWS